MHASERLWLRRYQVLDQGAHVSGMREVVHRGAKGFARTENVRLRERRIIRSTLGEEISAEQCRGLLFEEISALPCVREVWRVQPRDAVFSKRELLAIGERNSRTVGEVIDRDELRDLPADELRVETVRLKESLFRLNFKLALGEVDAVKRIREEKKSLARIQTIMKQREFE